MILVLGGTGNLGRVLIDLLCGAGELVRVLTRDPRRAARCPGRAEVLQGNLHDQDTVRRAMAGADRLFDLCFVESPNEVDRGITAAAFDAGIGHGRPTPGTRAGRPFPVSALERERALVHLIGISGRGTAPDVGGIMANAAFVSRIRAGLGKSVEAIEGTIQASR